MQVSFNATGTYTAGNVFTAQLSNATGSFASPLAIGSLAETNAGTHTINVNIPAGQPAGTGYRVRIISSNPSIEGSVNNADLVIHAQPSISAGEDQLICQGAAVNLSGSGGVAYSWNNDITNGVSFIPTATNTYTVIGTDANGCTNTDQVTVIVESCASIEIQHIEYSVYPNPTSGHLQVSFGSLTPNFMYLTDMNGKKIKELNPYLQTNEVSDVSSGMYLLHVGSEDFNIQHKIIIE
jgi:hypothetical protein